MVAVTTNPSTSEQSPFSQDSSQADDPLFLHHGESLGTVFVSQLLVGENYPTWARSVRRALISKNKLGFINGTLTLSSPKVKTSLEIQAWIRVDSIVGTWITNSISPRIQASIVYVDTALEIWTDLRERFSQGNGPRIFNLQK